ncbi:hypothetical protein Cgig2_001230 [Carnegiea gigantea]|uniref:NB-ARC domain-containing protein n=1 Tax=Carnegiea gigantea TaxID=171969 RepID=A0A9Q1Q9K8_9CARY|nr:hypothetical protein Cgig2_001230 [Carnegiea gigantea]
MSREIKKIREKLDGIADDAAKFDFKYVDKDGIDQVVRKLKAKLDRSKYLLVLDDMWTEDHGKWLELKDYLLGLGQRGSRMVVTTRSEKTARAVRSNIIYKLEGLSEEDSWHLFESIVGSGQAIRDDLVDIGKDILKNCANVPLAIKVIGSLLYDQDKRTWESLRHRRLSEIRKGENDVLPILKFSYHNLSPTLKSCFSYCAVFPKDFVIEKDMLISLWMAQGYLGALDEDQSMEDVGEEYFQILLQRCFFQDIKKDRYGEILSCKMHDLMHDVAQEVAGKEIMVANSTTGSLDPHVQIRHIYFEGNPSDCTNRFISKAQIRTYLQGGDSWRFQFPLSTLLKNWMNLRAVHLAGTRLQSLPNDIGKLLHLRHLDVSGSGLEMLPESLTKLVNLQTLRLRRLDQLRELPRDLARLVKLRVLDIPGCESLKYMPDGMNRMTCLNTLPMFVVAERDSSMKQQLEDLRALSTLKGSLEIRIDKKFVYKKKEMNSRGGYMSNKEYLNEIEIQWFGGDEDKNENEEDLLEDLQPHSNLRGLTIVRYRGTKIPRWGIENNLATFLPKLVDICISHCDGLQSLPWLGKLQFLKSLNVINSYNLKYMEDRIFSWSDSSTGSYGAAREVIQQESSSFFPSLESLCLRDLPKLKGWWRGFSTSGSVMEDDEMMGGESSVQTVGADRLPSFSQLSELEICDCHDLTVIPLCPTVETLTLRRFNERLQIMTKKKEDQREECGSSDSGSSSRDGPKMRVVSTDNARHLKSLPPVAFQCLANLDIGWDSKVESLSEIEVVFRSCSSSLRTLEIRGCSKLRSVSGGLEYLTALESLELWDLEELRFDETDGEGEGEEEERTDMPWRSLGQCLRSLTLGELTKVDDLPKGMSYLTALQSLTIDYRPLKDLPEWIECLSSLQSLQIQSCRHLESLPEALRKLTSLQRLELHHCNDIIERRCQNPNGEDWPKIQHIPNINLTGVFFYLP